MIEPDSQGLLPLEFQAPAGHKAVEIPFRFVTNDPRVPRFTVVLTATISNPE